MPLPWLGASSRWSHCLTKTSLGNKQGGRNTCSMENSFLNLGCSQNVGSKWGHKESSKLAGALERRSCRLPGVSCRGKGAYVLTLSESHPALPKGPSSPSHSPVRWGARIRLHIGGSRAQRGCVSCSVLHSWTELELGSKRRLWGSEARTPLLCCHSLLGLRCDL